MLPIVIVARNVTQQCHGLATVLRLHGFDVIEAGTGSAALAAAKGKKVAVLVTDLLMPGMNGLELGRRLRASSPGLAVLVTSEWDLSQRHLDLAGGSDSRLLPRPLTMEGLVGAVRRAARPRRHEPRSDPPSWPSETPTA